MQLRGFVNTRVSFIAEAADQCIWNDALLKVEESKAVRTELDVVEGMQFDRYASPYNYDSDNEAVLDNPYILITDDFHSRNLEY